MNSSTYIFPIPFGSNSIVTLSLVFGLNLNNITLLTRKTNEIKSAQNTISANASGGTGWVGDCRNKE
ncbi:hypothetical protein GCM10008014_20120 [Paenibacillus silvae]|uniref:Uncharacterized protein n=1 Tax=Paenibacillus silvae TaxID=1325358 RepID=A0ABQ1Z9S9_9BACL|nr:hypothetical protein GCM10008014_20120 [Paenibacillus silvae]